MVAQEDQASLIYQSSSRTARGTLSPKNKTSLRSRPGDVACLSFMKPYVQAQHYMIPIILARRRWRQEDQRSEVQGHIWVSRKLEFNFDYLSENLSQFKKKKQKKKNPVAFQALV